MFNCKMRKQSYHYHYHYRYHCYCNCHCHCHHDYHTTQSDTIPTFSHTNGRVSAPWHLNILAHHDPRMAGFSFDIYHVISLSQTSQMECAKLYLEHLGAILHQIDFKFEQNGTAKDLLFGSSSPVKHLRYSILGSCAGQVAEVLRLQGQSFLGSICLQCYSHPFPSQTNLKWEGPVQINKDQHIQNMVPSSNTELAFRELSNPNLHFSRWVLSEHRAPQNVLSWVYKRAIFGSVPNFQSHPDDGLLTIYKLCKRPWNLLSQNLPRP